nr:hypothetical protein GCM10020185_40570 [Pseudomonas brassicacearum subsp. brassicacearum]
MEQCLLRFFYAPGETIIKPADGPVEHFYIVKQGRVVGERPHTAKGGTETTFEITTGECFPLAALLGERATRTEHRAGEDTFCLQLNKLAFIKLFALSGPFRDFALRGVSSLLDQVNQQVQQKSAQTLGTQYSLNTRLGELAMRHPVSCSPDTAAARSREADARPAGRQHRGGERTESPGGDFSPCATCGRWWPMGPGIFFPGHRRTHDSGTVFFLSPDHSAFDAAIAMTERHIAHVCLVKDQRLCGVVSERDLFSLQRVDLVHLARTIRNAPRVENLVALRGEIGQLVERMLAHGASSTQITHIITLLNDHTVCRVIELTLIDKGDPGVPFSWLCFGSEGRREQTLHTDQDNGIFVRGPGRRPCRADPRSAAAHCPADQPEPGLVRLHLVQGQHHGRQPRAVPVPC